MGNVMILSETRGFLLASIQEHIEALDCQVISTRATVDDINRALIDPVSAILIYASDELLECQQALIYVRDCAVEENMAIFLVGNEDLLDEIERIIPSSVVQNRFSRPIDVKLLSQEVSAYVREMSRQSRKKILVVDDSGAMLRNVKGWLEHKYQVILANSGAMAIKYLALNRPDLILLDYEMPVCDGRQVLQMIRSETDFNDIPVIFLTGKDDRESVMQVMALKPQGYLLKTLRPEQIVQSVDSFFANRKWETISDNGKN